MITLQDRYIGITKLENKLSYIDYDKSTKVCSSDIAQFFDEYYPEFFESIASDDRAYATFNYRLDVLHYFSFGEIAADYLADNENLNQYDFLNVLANNHGYENIEEMERDYIVICDVAIDGAIVIG